MRALTLLFTFLVALTFASCGSEATDRPQDCRDDQYYNEALRLCQTCPAVQEPTCRPSCGAEIVSDQRGCPVMICDDLCPGCDSDQYWNSEDEQCVDIDEVGDVGPEIDS